MRVAVTGATGFVGGAAVRRLAARGHTVVAFGRRPDRPVALPPGVEYRLWDIAAGPSAAPPDVDAVVHAAAAVGAWGPAEPFRRVNVEGTRHVLATFPDAYLVHVSSASVYDPLADREGIAEAITRPVRYLNAYGHTKRLAERVIHNGGRPAAILRPRAVYGPGDTTLLPRLLRAYRGGRLVTVGSGQNRASITAIDNLLDAVELALDRRVSGTYNVADATAPTVDTLLRALLRALGRQVRFLRLPVRLAWLMACGVERVAVRLADPGEPLLTRYAVANLSRTCTLDLSAARRELGYRPTLDYRDVLPRLGWAGRPPG